MIVILLIVWKEMQEHWLVLLDLVAHREINKEKYALRVHES